MKKNSFKLVLFMIMGFLLIVSGCSGNNSNDSESNSSLQNSDSNQKVVGNLNIGYQLEKPNKGEEIAIINTNMGTLKLRFFPDEAPKACENFKKHSKDGYYNGLKFHRVIKNFMVQSGDPKGDSTGGESIWGEPFEDEFSSNLFNITGAVAMANSGKDKNTSQFFINQVSPKEFIGFEHLESAYEAYKKNPELFSKHYGSTVDMEKITDEIKDFYSKNGGNPFLDGKLSTIQKGHTVFAQVFEGMDVVKKISESKTDDKDKPLKDIIIKKIEIVNYEE